MADRVWVSTRKGLFELRRAARAWEIAHVSFLGEPVSALLAPDARSPGRPMIAALNLGHFGVKCHASDNQGRDWREVGTPTYPPQPEPRPQGEVDWKLLQIWTLEALGDDIWAGTLPGGLFHSADRGESWRLNRALWDQPGRRDWFGGGYDVPGIHSIALDRPRGSQAPLRLRVGISCGGYWISDDAGLEWRLSAEGMRAAYMPPDQADEGNTQDPHRVVACARAPEHLWCQHHNGIWRSTNGGANWQVVEPVPLSSFGFACAVDPTNPARAWFVPGIADQCRVPVDGALSVLRTDDGGASFQVLREGLPRPHAYDLVYRHALAIDPEGRTLMMGSTTGGLWVSDDLGEHWTTVSRTLPPIHAVNFEIA